MKAGSLVVPILSTTVFIQDAAREESYFVPKAPSPEQIYTCKAIYPHPNNSSVICIELEEIYTVTKKKGENKYWLFAKAWKEVQPPMKISIEELLTELEPI
jgi:hypothetical protein